MKKPNDSACLAFTTKTVGDKWTPRLIFAIASGECSRFNEIQKESGGINPRTLSKRLADLETIGAISKKTDRTNPLRAKYNLTKKGRDLLPILKQMATWGEKYL